MDASCVYMVLCMPVCDEHEHGAYYIAASSPCRCHSHGMRDTYADKWKALLCAHITARMKQQDKRNERVHAPYNKKVVPTTGKVQCSTLNEAR